MQWQERIGYDPAVLAGKPIVRGTRISVEQILELLAGGWTQDQLLANYPTLRAEDIRAALAYAKDVLAEERVFPAGQ